MSVSRGAGDTSLGVSSSQNLFDLCVMHQTENGARRWQLEDGDSGVAPGSALLSLTSIQQHQQQAQVCLSRKGSCGGGCGFSKHAQPSSLECQSSFCCSCPSSGPSEGPAQLCHEEGQWLSQCQAFRREGKSPPCCSPAGSCFPSSRSCVPLYFVCLARDKNSDLRSS